MKNNLVLTFALVLMILSVFMIGTPITQIKATPSSTQISEVSKAVRLTSSHFYNRNPSFFRAQDGAYWLFYTEGETDPATPSYNPDSDTYDVYYMTSSDNGTTWSTQSLLDLSNPWPSERDVSAFQGSNGTIWVFSASGYGPGSDNVIRYYTYNSTIWSGPYLVTSGGNNVTGGHIDALQDGTGKIWVFYEDSSLIYCTSYNGSAWSSPVQISETGKHGGTPRAMIDASGDFNVAWCGWTEGGIYRSASSDGVSWPTPQLILTSSYTACDPTIVQDANGTYWLFWAPWDSTSDSQWLEVVSSVDGTTWSSSIHVTCGGYGDSYWWDMWPEAYVKPDGDMLLFYTSEVASGSYVKGDGNIWMFEVVWNLTNEHYEFVQNAIDAAGVNSTVIVHDGTYTEDLSIPATKTNLEIKPYAGSSVTIKGVQNVPATSFPLAIPNIKVNASGVKIHGFTIEGPDYTSGNYSSGIIIGAPNVEVYDNAFKVTPAANLDEISQAIQTYHKNAQPGVDISGLSIHNNTFTHLSAGVAGYEGIYINQDEGTSSVTVQYNQFSGNVVRAITTERSKTTISSNVIMTDLAPGLPGGYQGINVGGANDGNVADVSVTGNTVNGSAGGKGFKYGIKLGYLSTSTFTNVSIINNTVQMNEVGVLAKFSVNDVRINRNNIFGNTNYGLSVTDTSETADATYNWWGNGTGPYHAITNPSGTGDNVSDNVDYEPWLIKPYPPAVQVPKLYVDSVTMESPSYGKNFTTGVSLTNVTDLYGFEFQLYWNTTLLDLVDVDILSPWADYAVGTDQINETIGRYWVGISALGPSPSFNGSLTLANLTFKITYVPVYPENVSCLFDLNATTLGDPDGNPIPHIVDYGEYKCYAAKTKIQVIPEVTEAKALNHVFNVSVTVANVANLYNLEFELQYNTTLLDAKEMTVASFPDTTYKVSKKIIDDTQGVVTLRIESINPSLQVNESLKLAIITFEVTYAVQWPNPPIESYLSFGFTELITETEVTVPHDRIEGTYRYRPIPGDLNSDGTVNIRDLFAVAKAFGAEPGDTNWNELADLNNDNIINILDLIRVARNYGRTD